MILYLCFLKPLGKKVLVVLHTALSALTSGSAWRDTLSFLPVVLARKILSLGIECSYGLSFVFEKEGCHLGVLE